jgi:hypothetical protein
MFEAQKMSAVCKEGSTVINATGNWRDTQSGNLITEPTHTVVYFHKNTKQIDSLRILYKTMFDQRSVLRVDKKATLGF